MAGSIFRGSFCGGGGWKTSRISRAEGKGSRDSVSEDSRNTIRSAWTAATSASVRMWGLRHHGGASDAGGRISSGDLLQPPPDESTIGRTSKGCLSGTKIVRGAA